MQQMDTVRNDLSTADVARIVGVHRDTLLRWLREGLVPEPRRDRHGWRIFGTREAQLIAQFAHSATKPESTFTPDISKLAELPQLRE